MIPRLLELQAEKFFPLLMGFVVFFNLILCCVFNLVNWQHPYLCWIKKENFVLTWNCLCFCCFQINGYDCGGTSRLKHCAELSIKAPYLKKNILVFRLNHFDETEESQVLPLSFEVCIEPYRSSLSLRNTLDADFLTHWFSSSMSIFSFLT